MISWDVNSKPFFGLQWHLTNICDFRCKHCYITHSQKNKKQSNTSISEERALGIVDEFKSFCDHFHLSGRIYLTGGNPLLNPFFFDLAEYIKSKNISVGVLGNPITDQKTIDKLVNIELSVYQLSIDGEEQYHDYVRGKGKFKEAIKSIELLLDAGIFVSVHPTITKYNMQDMPKLAERCASLGVRSFDFSRFVPVGEGKKLKNMLPTPQEFKDFLLLMKKTYTELKKKFPIIHFGNKEPLWALLEFELGSFSPTKSEYIIRGCTIGHRNITIDSDGTVYSCRRLAEPIGDIKKENLYNIFLFSEKMKQHRNFQLIKECGECELFSYCRGCRASAKYEYNNYYGKDPLCWK